MRRTIALLITLSTLTGCQSVGEVIAPAPEPENITTLTPVDAPSATQWRPAVRPDSVHDAALDVVTDYFAISDDIARSGGQSADPLKPVVTADWFVEEVDGVRGLLASRIRTIGSTSFDHFAIQSARTTVDGAIDVAVFVCVDQTAVWVIPADAPEPPDDLIQWLADGADPELISDDTLETWQAYLDEVAPTAGIREPVVIWLRGNQIDSLAVDGTENWRGHHPCGESP